MIFYTICFKEIKKCQDQRDLERGGPTVETEVNGVSKSTNERGPFLVGSLGLSCAYKQFCYALTVLVRTIQIIFFLIVHYLIS